MNDPSTAGPKAEPNILIPKTIGLMNVIFSVALMGCGMCYAFYVPGLASLGKLIETEQREQKAKKAIARKADIDALKVQEAKAETEQEKAAIRGQIEAISDVPPAPVIDLGFKNFGFDDPRVLGYFIADAASGLLLNLVLFVAGIGLLRRSEWARKLGVGVAVAKVARLGLLACWLIVVARPVMLARAEVSFKEIEEAPAAGGDAPMSPESARELISGVDKFTITFGLVTLLAGAIYPALSIALLTRPSARLACEPARRTAPRDEFD